MTDNRVREIVHEELSHHALAGGILDDVIERKVSAYVHTHVTTASLTPGVGATRDFLRMHVHRLDDALAAFDPAAGGEALARLLWRWLTPVVGGVSGLPRGESPGQKGAGGAGAVGPDTRGHPPPGDPDLGDVDEMAGAG
jgi:hypothetical protein